MGWDDGQAGFAPLPFRVFASTNELSTRSLRTSHGSAGRVPSPGACIEGRQFIAAKQPFRRGSVLRARHSTGFSIPIPIPTPAAMAPARAPRPSSLCRSGMLPLGSCSLNNGFDFQEDCSTTIIPRWGKRMSLYRSLFALPPYPGGISADSGVAKRTPGSRRKGKQPRRG